MDKNLARRLAVFGIMGGLLMFFWDLCFYMLPISGADFLRTSVMNTMDTKRLIIGAAAGPLAGLLYGLGAMMFYVGLKQHNKRAARITAALFAVMFVVGGAYHSIYTTYGFVPVGDMSGMNAKITALIDSLHAVSFITGLSASFLFIYMVLRYDMVFLNGLSCSHLRFGHCSIGRLRRLFRIQRAALLLAAG